MIALSCFDLLYISMSIMIFSIPSIFPTMWTSTTYLYMITICLPIAQVGMSGSIYLTLAIAMERYSTVCHPFWKVREWLTLSDMGGAGPSIARGEGSI